MITHPKILEAAVVGRPDEKSGELPTAFVVRRTSDVTEKELQDFIAGKRLQRHMHSLDVIFNFEICEGLLIFRILFIIYTFLR